MEISCDNIDLIYAIKHGGKIIYQKNDDIIIKYHETYFIRVKDIKIIESHINEDYSMLCIHGNHEITSLNKLIEVKQYAYIKDDNELINIDNVIVKSIGIECLDIINKYYHNIDRLEYLISRIKSNCFLGAFIEEELVGFIGIHDEGTIGFLFVREEYRNLGVASSLESHMIQRLKEQDELIFLQIELGNEASKAMHLKLGYSQGNEIITWYQKSSD